MKLPPSNSELDVANYEDLCRLSELWAKEDVSNSDIRNSSHIVRRLLIDGDLAKSAAPRGVRLMFSAPDNKPLVKASASGLVDFWQSAGTKVYGVWIRAAMLQRTPLQTTDTYFRGWDPELTIELRLDSFLKQEVFFYMGQPVTRLDVISYVANKAGGPHFDKVRDKAHETLDRIRSGVSITLKDGMPSFGISPNQFTKLGDDFLPLPNSMDPVFLELAATCRYISVSPVVESLAATLKASLGR